MGSDGVRGDGHSTLSASSLHAFHNLVDLQVSMGEPISVLTAVESLDMLRRFVWSSNHIGIQYNKHDSQSYVLRSKSLQTVELATGKSFHLADINCPSLQALKLDGSGIYSGGIICGRDVIGHGIWFIGQAQNVYYVSESVRYADKETVKATALYGLFYEKEWGAVSHLDEAGEFGEVGAMTNQRFAVVFNELLLPSECKVTFG